MKPSILKLQFLTAFLFLLTFVFYVPPLAAQTPRPCAGKNPSVKEAKVDVTKTGDVDIVPCAGRQVLVNGSPLAGGGATVGNATTTAAGKLTASANGSSTAIVDSDQRVEKVLSVNFGNSLINAVAAIGATPTKLLIKSDTALSANLTIPANITIERESGAKIVKSGAAKLVCAGNCLSDPMSDSAIFSGFSPGDVTFAGTVYPKEISAGLWDNATASARINAADKSLLGKAVKIYATPGLIAERVVFSDNHSFKFLAGDYPNTVGVYEMGSFDIGDYVTIDGEGDATNIFESSTTDATAIGVFYSRAVQISGANGRNVGITIKNLKISGTTAAGAGTNQTKAAIMLGNCENCTVENVHLYRTHGFGAYVGGNSGDGYTARNCKIINSIFEQVGSQNVGSINSDGLIISGNQFIGGGLATNGYGYYIDLEPNGTYESGSMRNVIISNNLFDGKNQNPNRAVHAIKINAAGVPRVENVSVNNNVITGWAQGDNPNNLVGLGYGIWLIGVETGSVKGNQIQGTKNVGLFVEDSANITVSNNDFTSVGDFNSIPAWIVRGVTNSVFKDNSFPLIRNQQRTELPTDSHFGSSKLISEVPRSVPVSVTTSGGVTTVTITQGDLLAYDFWKGGTVALATAAGVTAGDYKAANVNFGTKTITLTALNDAAANAGNGSTTLTTKFSNNLYIDNLNAEYSIQPGSKTVNTATRYSEDWTVTIAGSLAQTGDVAWRFFPEAARINQLTFKVRTPPNGGTSPIVQAQVIDVYNNLLSTSDIYLVGYGGGFDYVATSAPINIPANSYVKLKMIQAASDVNAANATLSFVLTR